MGSETIEHKIFHVLFRVFSQTLLRGNDELTRGKTEKLAPKHDTTSLRVAANCNVSLTGKIH